MMKRCIKKVLRKAGFQIVRYRSQTIGNIGRVATMAHENNYKGNALLSYINDPFFLNSEKEISNAHHNHWLSWQIAKTFSKMGFTVDVVDYRDSQFIPIKKYNFFVGARTNFLRISRYLNEDCVKIVHLDTAHWLFNNLADYQRHLDLQKRRGVTIKGFKLIEPNWAIECADYVTTNWGNQFNVSTYWYAKKPIIQIPLPTCTIYDWPEDKDFNKCKKHFLWIGSKGLVHKGLDLVLEAFASMQEYDLTVCGPIRRKGQEYVEGPLKNEPGFEAEYYKELYETPNIHTEGWVDIESQHFLDIVKRCVGIVFPSCSEGGGASVITCMQAGLIPIVSYESNVEVDGMGFKLKDCSIEEIRNSIRMVSAMPVRELELRARKTWEYARAYHTRERFAEDYRRIVKKITAIHHERKKFHKSEIS